MSRVPAFRRVAIVAKVGPPEAPVLAARLAEWLVQRDVEVVFDRATAQMLDTADGFPRESLPDDCELAIVAGGDGTLLSVARSAIPQGVPILGVNLGSLGFLTEIQPDELDAGLERLFAGGYEIEERQALCVRYFDGDSEPSEYALVNDAVLTKSALARMILIDLEFDGIRVTTYTADGLIISTPTGSTAYSLSAGGPILDPRMSAFVVAPICPHKMTYRPLVVPGSVTVDVRLRDADEEVYLTLDGQVGFPMDPGGRIEVSSHAHPVRLVRVAGREFFQVLRHKLRWGER